MTMKFPQSKGARTRSAKVLDAIAADMERVVESLRLSATQLRNGVNIGVAANTHVIAMNFLYGHPIRCYRSTFKD
jgi:hypothetical protein